MTRKQIERLTVNAAAQLRERFGGDWTPISTHAGTFNGKKYAWRKFCPADRSAVAELLICESYGPTIVAQANVAGRFEMSAEIATIDRKAAEKWISEVGFKKV